MARRSLALAKESAGFLLYRRDNHKVEVLLVHPGGPFFKRRDDGVWSIPKGEIDAGEAPMDVARREFQEELGQPAPQAEMTSLGTVRQGSGKIVHAWAAPGDVDVEHIDSNQFEIEWPPRSGTMQKFPEIDRAQWFDLEAARRKILPAQQTFLDRLEKHLS